MVLFPFKIQAKAALKEKKNDLVEDKHTSRNSTEIYLEDNESTVSYGYDNVNYLSTLNVHCFPP